MSEMKELDKLEILDLATLDSFYLEPLYEKILKELHLEIAYDRQLYLISPGLTVLSPEKVPQEVEEFLSRKNDFLEYLKKLILRNLLEYSFIVEAHSYFIEQNGNTLIARLREKDAAKMKYEVKFYTHSPDEILDHYQDKIYIGRDFLFLDTLRRPRYGIEDHLASIPFEIRRLREKYIEKIRFPGPETDEYLKELEALGEEFTHLAADTLRALPPSFQIDRAESLDNLQLLSTKLREVKHYLLEIKEELKEYIEILRRNEEKDFVRYAVKCKKDLVNLIILLNVKFLGPVVEEITHRKP